MFRPHSEIIILIMKDFNPNPYNVPSRTYKNKKDIKNTKVTEEPIQYGRSQDSKFRIKVSKIEILIFKELINTTDDPELRLMYSKIIERWDRDNQEFTLSLSASERIHKSFNKDNF